MWAARFFWRRVACGAHLAPLWACSHSERRYFCSRALSPDWEPLEGYAGHAAWWLTCPVFPEHGKSPTLRVWGLSLWHLTQQWRKAPKRVWEQWKISRTCGVSEISAGWVDGPVSRHEGRSTMSVACLTHDFWTGIFMMELCVWVCTSVYGSMWVCTTCLSTEARIRLYMPPELGLQVLMRHPMWVLGTYE